MIVRLDVPVDTVSEVNRHESYWVTWKRSKNQKQTTMWHLLGLGQRPKLPCRVQMTRYYPGELDTDNLASSCKYVRDTVAKYLGCGDSPRDPIEWLPVRQVRVKRKTEAKVRVEIEELG